MITANVNVLNRKSKMPFILCYHYFDDNMCLLTPPTLLALLTMCDKNVIWLIADGRKKWLINIASEENTPIKIHVTTL